MGAEQSLIGGGMSPEDTCVICYGDGPEEIENEEGQVEQVEQVQICPTRHYAHLSCITKWYAKADTCPECRVNVRGFPLWREMNPDAQEYNPEFRLTTFTTNPEFQRIMNENNYHNALQYFETIDVRTRLMQDEERYQRLYDHYVTQRGSTMSEVLIRNQPLIVEIMRNGAFNVANALNDFMIRNNIQQPNIGPIIDLFREELTIINWLYQHDYNVSFEFLKDAVNTLDEASVSWYFENVNPDINQQLLAYYEKIRQFYGDTRGESRRIYDIFTQYINQQGGSMQYGGMWQRGGFFMTCS